MKKNDADESRSSIKLPRGEFSIGDWKWAARQGSVGTTYSSSGAGTSILLSLIWKRDKDQHGSPGPIDAYVARLLADVSPEGPNAGKLWAWAESDQDIHHVREVVVKHVQFEYPPGKGCGTATMILSGPKPNILAEGEWLARLLAARLQHLP